MFSDLVSSPMNISRPEFTLASTMGSVPTDEIIQYPTELHLFLVIRTCNFIRSIRNDYETFLHINILFGIHPAAATDVQTYAS
ncbi:Small ribosomal subunit protein [Trichinella spiralis]|uniref:Small ribosomal subunit protein n=1 Tax=Trichinella spiralis TaxID=6334 RepID=A0ABR3KCW0_TRISP